ncbi:MAG: uroporphyrinogen decarboxylase family protein [Verrucomicrobiae bacterium]|nr:uroporphyrinogen decarboxylase family protein [Verrucomicrobiae bacterium]
MTPEQWQTFRRAAKRETLRPIPLALIVDSPWIPLHIGINHLDYYFDPEVWFRANLQIHQEFPNVIFLPSWWAEIGMAAEPSALGVRIRFWKNQTPSEERIPFRLDDLPQLTQPDPHTDGFMPLILHRYRHLKQRIADAGHIIPVVAARGPLCTAAFFRGVTELLTDIIEAPEQATKLLDITTQLTIDWLKAQAEIIGPTVEGILVLDDIVGFLGRNHYQEFAHPRLKRICAAFPQHWVKIYHNDANVAAFLDMLPDTGFDVLNWGKQLPVAEAARRIDGRMTLMGNVNPLEIGVRGTPEDVATATREVLHNAGSHPLILSLGGGVSPGMPTANIQAMLAVLEAFNRDSP